MNIHTAIKFISVLLATSVFFTGITFLANAEVGTELLIGDFNSAATADFAALPLVESYNWGSKSNIRLVSGMYSKADKCLEFSATGYDNGYETGGIKIVTPADTEYEVDNYYLSANVYIPEMADTTYLKLVAGFKYKNDESFTSVNKTQYFGPSGEVADSDKRTKGKYLQNGWNNITLHINKNSDTEIQYRVKINSSALVINATETIDTNATLKELYVRLSFIDDEEQADREISEKLAVDNIKFGSGPSAGQIDTYINADISSVDDVFPITAKAVQNVEHSLTAEYVKENLTGGTVQIVNIDDGIATELDDAEMMINATHIISTNEFGAIKVREVSDTSAAIIDLFYQGAGIEGRRLTAKYTLVHEGEDMSTFRWLISDSKNGTYTPIDGATGNSYLLTSNEVGKYIKLEVTPKTDSYTDDPVSTEGYLVEAASSPEVTSAELHGTGKSNEELWVSYHWKDANNEPIKDTFYKWQVSSDGAQYEYIQGADAQSFIPDNSYVGKYVRASVKLNKLGSTDTIATGDLPTGAEVFSNAVLIKEKATAQNVQFAVLNDQWSGSFQFVSTSDASEGTHKFYWEISDTADGEYKLISTEQDAKISAAYKDSYVRFSVAPVTAEGVAGDRVYAQPVKLSGKAVTKLETSFEERTKNDIVYVGTTEPCYVSGMVFSLECDGEEPQVESEQFDVLTSSQNGRCLVTLIPKENESVYVEDIAATITAAADTVYLANTAAITVGGDDEMAVTLMPMSREELEQTPYIISDLVCEKGADGKYTLSRTIKNNTENEEKIVLICAKYNGSTLVDCAVDSIILEGFAEDILEVTVEAEDTYITKTFLWNEETLKPYIEEELVTDFETGGVE